MDYFKKVLGSDFSEEEEEEDDGEFVNGDSVARSYLQKALGTDYSGSESDSDFDVNKAQKEDQVVASGNSEVRRRLIDQLNRLLQLISPYETAEAAIAEGSQNTPEIISVASELLFGGYLPIYIFNVEDLEAAAARLKKTLD